MKKLLAVMVGATILMGGASLSRADWGYNGYHHGWHHGWGVAFPYYSVAPVYCAPPAVCSPPVVYAPSVAYAAPMTYPYPVYHHHHRGYVYAPAYVW